MTFWRGEVNTSTTDKMRTATSTLPLIDQLFAVLVRLKVGLFVQDISDRFQISPGVILNVLYHMDKFITC